MKVTMKDIANKLGISINAVSIALNDKPGVSDEMRLEILKMADKMGYINQKRQYLSVYSKSNICILMQSYYADTGHFYSIVLRSIVEQAKVFGYFSILNYFEDGHFVVPECIEERKVAGILVVGKISDSNLLLLGIRIGNSCFRGGFLSFPLADLFFHILQLLLLRVNNTLGLPQVLGHAQIAELVACFPDAVIQVLNDFLNSFSGI